MMALANMQMHQIAHMYLVNKILQQEPRSARLTGAAGMMEVCSGGIWKHSWVIWGPSRAILGDLGGCSWVFFGSKGVTGLTWVTWVMGVMGVTGLTRWRGD